MPARVQRGLQRMPRHREGTGVIVPEKLRERHVVRVRDGLGEIEEIALFEIGEDRGERAAHRFSFMANSRPGHSIVRRRSDIVTYSGFNSQP